MAPWTIPGRGGGGGGGEIIHACSLFKVAAHLILARAEGRVDDPRMTLGLQMAPLHMTQLPLTFKCKFKVLKYNF